MKFRNFRYIFKNSKEGILHSGCILDSYHDKMTNYYYMAQAQRKSDAKYKKMKFMKEKFEYDLNILIFGSYSISYVKNMIDIVKNNHVITVILPYILPIQRSVLCHWIGLDESVSNEVIEFMEHPHTFLKNEGVENVYYLYGNGEHLNENFDYLNDGHYFESLEDDLKFTIFNLEGEEIPIVKAGYIVDNSWIFYFGQYSRELTEYSEFTFSHEKYGIHALSAKRVNKETIKERCYEYVKLFGSIISSSVVMYQGPIFESLYKTDCVFAAKMFHVNQNCKTEIPMDGSNCLIKCMYQNDFDMLKKHKLSTRTEPCIGILVLGNINLNTFLTEIIKRFQYINNKTRVITIPNCGKGECWNRNYLSLINLNDIRYWVCSMHHNMDPLTISNVIMSSTYNRVVTTNADFGYCFSGYLVPGVEEKE